MAHGWEEIRHQFTDQPLHFVWSLAAGLLPWAGWHFGGPIGLVAGAAACVANMGFQVYREWRQWPSNRWYDPPMDWFFQALGYVAAGAFWWRLG